MRFTGLCLYTVDVPRLVDFYSKALCMKAEGDDIHSLFEFGGTALVIYNPKGPEEKPESYPTNMRESCYSFAFNVDDVDIEYERLKKLGVDFIELPITHPWGWRSLTFRDPDGNAVIFNMRVDQLAD